MDVFSHFSENLFGYPIMITIGMCYSQLFRIPNSFNTKSHNHEIKTLHTNFKKQKT